MDDIRKLLRVNEFKELKNIPTAYLALAFDQATYEKYEYVGDSIFHSVIVDMMLNFFLQSDVNPKKMTVIRSIIESNNFFTYIMNKKGICTSTIPKRCADIFEALIGVMYVYLREKGNMFASIDVIYEWLCEVFYIDVIVDAIMNGKDAYDTVDRLYVINPIKYQEWSKWSSCDNEGISRRTRKCIRGDCADLIETRYCSTWTKCDEIGLRKRWNAVTNEYDYEACSHETKCDEEGTRYIINQFTGTSQKQTCPDELYSDTTYINAQCFDGNEYVYRKCIDPDKCIDKIIDTIPCNDNEVMIPLDTFRNLSIEEKDMHISKGLMNLEERGLPLVPFRRNKDAFYANILGALLAI